MQTFKYTGDDPVDIVVDGQGVAGVTKGTHVEFSPEQAKGLDGSPTWQHVPARKPRKKAAKKTAAKKTAASAPVDEPDVVSDDNNDTEES